MSPKDPQGRRRTNRATTGHNGADTLTFESCLLAAVSLWFFSASPAKHILTARELLDDSEGSRGGTIPPRPEKSLTGSEILGMPPLISWFIYCLAVFHK